jgi:hypothetical protein
LNFSLISEQNRTWIYKPRYSYAGQGIHVISANSDLEPVFKMKVIGGNRIQYQPKSPGYLMQEYRISIFCFDQKLLFLI